MRNSVIQKVDMNIVKGDRVLVISGRNKGEQGAVEKVVPETNRVVVAGVNIRKHHLKRSQKNSRGGIAEYPAPFSRAAVIIICPHCSKPTRVARTVGSNSKKYRQCKKCQGSLDTK